MNLSWMSWRVAHERTFPSSEPRGTTGSACVTCYFVYFVSAFFVLDECENVCIEVDKSLSTKNKGGVVVLSVLLRRCLLAFASNKEQKRKVSFGSKRFGFLCVKIQDGSVDEHERSDKHTLFKYLSRTLEAHEDEQGYHRGNLRRYRCHFDWTSFRYFEGQASSSINCEPSLQWFGRLFQANRQ